MELLKSSIVGLFLCYVSIAYGQRTPTISHITQEQIRDIGGQVDLDCSVHYANEYPVIWVKYDRLRTTESIPLSTNAGLILRDSRFSLRYDDATATYTLSIKDIQENDAGWYQCQVLISLTNKITAEVELQVRRPPIISDNSTRSLVASEGESAQMNCYAGGFPPPKIYWRRENNAILPTGGSIYNGNVLKITHIHKEDRGTYYCVAENGVGKGARRNINLEVEFAPVVTVPRPRLGQALQYDMDLECHVEAYPPPAITWLKDEFELSNNQHYRISHFATADEFTDTTIRVLTIEKKQYGTFTCKAQNKLGSDEGHVQLFETIVPVCPPACDQARYNGVVTLAPSVGTMTALLALYAAYAFRRIANTRH
ncbi:lachesin isoform X1 [Plodia interpunctella]|uniref:lachesin isoform X1 n=1 Tax=Plodia interpunctella TaxID=58824 RepID=UPI00236747E5|nr:lachesin isoform X1 [Plodia interpunctella]